MAGGGLIVELGDLLALQFQVFVLTAADDLAFDVVGPGTRLGLHRVPCRSSQSLPHGFVKILGPLNEILLRVVAELEPHIPRLVPTVEPPRAVCLERG